MDVIGDYLTAIRNAVLTHKKEVAIPVSRLRQELSRILLEEGYISNFQVLDKDWPPKILIQLKYSAQGESVIRGLKRASKQSRRVYRKAKELPWVRNGLGTAVISTSQGMMSDRQARRLNVGGEVVCEVW
ncbi:30S ribosomal protein S8 [candidate division TA06 bacterium B3_TA06]|uniref:Small ribosomal subunit protein uS8 n=1 Tax=candidate division TA06 bacterium B3_TA06 TaxID=2012487 RepID=A0A532V429_UNCT6|nr:MAG: 30S ribosomal protein S8 [candidate division TA06 bacterium B3_TA06]